MMNQVTPQQRLLSFCVTIMRNRNQAGPNPTNVPTIRPFPAVNRPGSYRHNVLAITYDIMNISFPFCLLHLYIDIHSVHEFGP